MSAREEETSDSVRAMLIDAAYRLITQEGVESLTVRRLAKEAETSTMAVYSRFGSVGAVAGAVCERGFVEFADALRAAGTSDDPVADLIGQGLDYLRFATENPRLYTLMFQYTSPDWGASKRTSLLQHGNPTDSSSGRAAFLVMVDALRRVAPDDDETELLIRAGATWSMVHGLAMLSIAGHLTGVHDLVARSALIALVVGYGTTPTDAEQAFEAARDAITRTARSGR